MKKVFKNIKTYISEAKVIKQVFDVVTSCSIFHKYIVSKYTF